MSQKEDDIFDDVTDDELKKAKDQRKQDKANKNPIKESLKNRAKNKIKEKINFEAFTSGVRKVVIKILPAAIVIIVGIGLISFFMNMPGLMRGRLNEVIYKSIDAIKDVFTGNTAFDLGDNRKLNGKYISYEKRKELLNYISSDLGFDVIAFGFVPTAVYDSEEDNLGKQIIKDYSPSYYIGRIPSVAEQVDADVNPDADLLYYYLMANERTYVKNTDGYTGDYRNVWKGMLNFNERSFDGMSIEVDRENEILKINCNNPNWGEVLNKDGYAIKMDDWTARYGMPIEFSLALHISTMSSGLVKELITNEDLQTQVYIDLKQANCNINFKFHINGKEVNIPFKAQGDINSLYNKMVRNCDIRTKDSIGPSLLPENTITEDDISIVSLLAAAEKTINSYRLNVEDDFNLETFTRHIDAMDAILGTNDIAVKTYNTEFGEWHQYDSGYYSTYAYESLGRNGGYSLDGVSLNDRFNGTADIGYNMACGAYICTYDPNTNMPNENSGKLKASIFSTSVVGDINNYELKYKLKEKDNTHNLYLYDIYYKNYTSGEEGFLNRMNQVVPIGDEFTWSYNGMYENGNNATTTVKRIQGLGSILEDGQISMAELIKLDRNKDGYEAMFKEIDWTLGTLYRLDSNRYRLNYYNCNLGEYMRTNDPQYILYYTKQFNNCMNALNEGNLEQAQIILQTLLNMLRTDCETLKAEAIQTESAKEKIDQILVAFGWEGLTVDNLRTIVEKFSNDSNVNNGEVKYAQPRITKVIKHWYKDVYFGEDIEAAYKKTTDPITLSYTEETTGKNIQVDAILTPIDANRDYLYKQESEPYVIKGDVVLLDNEIVDSNTATQILNTPTGDPNYNWGDGYRATKKIFTQGQYYTLDGSAETARSIFWQQQFEELTPEENNANGGVYTVHVADGRIVDIGFAIDRTLENRITTDLEGNTLELPDGIIIWSQGEKTFDREHVDTSTYGALREGVTVKFYRVTVTNTDSIKYLSPTSHSYEEVCDRVNKINAMWDAMGVRIHRQHLSLDNSSVNGEAMATAGLSILKNCDTDAADAIYRDLKEMLMDLGYYTQAEFDQLDNAVLDWFIPSYLPEKWPQNNVKEFKFKAMLYPVDKEQDDNSIIDKLNEENADDEHDYKVKGFEAGLDVIAPGNSKILKCDYESGTIQLEFDGITQPEISVLNEYIMTIEGINLDSDLRVGETIEKGKIIGTTGDRPIIVFLVNDIGRVLSNVEDYMDVPRTKLTLENDYYVNTESNENVITDIETFKMMFSEYENIVDNAEAFLDMQEKYGVNAVFAAAVCITESSAGKAWDLIPSYTYNWFSISGSYHGQSVYTNRAWCKYTSFAESVDHFGELISGSGYYFRAGKFTVSEIAPTYCNEQWGETVSKIMTNKLKLIMEGND